MSATPVACDHVQPTLERTLDCLGTLGGLQEEARSSADATLAFGREAPGRRRKTQVFRALYVLWKSKKCRQAVWIDTDILGTGPPKAPKKTDLGKSSSPLKASTQAPLQEDLREATVNLIGAGGWWPTIEISPGSLALFFFLSFF